MVRKSLSICGEVSKPVASWQQTVGLLTFRIDCEAVRTVIPGPKVSYLDMV